MDDVALFESLAPMRERVRASVGEVIVGQDEVVDLMITALLANGHCLFVGVPGLAKTLLVHTMAQAIGLDFQRIQFTPDLMPADITGTEVMDQDPETGRRHARFVQGPVFTHLLLADEINRTPPKTQSALLEAMQERSVTAAGVTREIAAPFLVFATQNPIEQEGTYPLPEAQQDRFMFSVPVGYPSELEEVEILRRTTIGDVKRAPCVLDRDTLLQAQALLRRLPANEHVLQQSVRLATATRPGSGSEASRWVRWGAGPRASQCLAVGARTRAALRGREVPDMDDVRAVALPVLRHRVLLNFEAEAMGHTADEVVTSIIDEVLG
jgi:MoxR-like ATPase